MAPRHEFPYDRRGFSGAGFIEVRMRQRDAVALRHCEAGLLHMWRGEFGEALAEYDTALGSARGEETRELITIRKAEALVAADRPGAEISELAAIVMRRGSARHVYLAATVLLQRYSNLDDRRRAIFYGEIACATVAALEDPFARATVLNNMGVVLTEDSQFERAIDSFQQALDRLEEVPEHPNADRLRCRAMLNLGGAKILNDVYDEGIRIIERVVDQVDDDQCRADGLLDLSLGYVHLGVFGAAEKRAREALALARNRRQIRNANLLMGAICARAGKWEEAETYFDVVAAFYPAFKNLKQLLTAIDLCKIVNWTLPH